MVFIGYDEVINDFRRYENSELWEAKITVEGACQYLNEHLKKSLINDFEPAYTEYKKIGGVGFYALLRMIFPYVTFLGSLFKGSDSSVNAIDFIKDCLGQVDIRYREYGDILYVVYRHGLIHTNMPKTIEIEDVNVGWMVSLDKYHLIVTSPVSSHITLSISAKNLFDDLCKAIELYIEELMGVPELFKNFKSGFIEMGRVHEEAELLKKKCHEGIKNMKQHIELHSETVGVMNRYFIEK